MILIVMAFCANVYSQTMPLVYSVENTGAECPVPYLPSLSELPNISSLPDPFEWSDGRGRIMYFSDWKYRRAEIKAEIENYEIGLKPGRPDTVTASYSNGTLTVNVIVNGRSLTLTSQIILPEGSGPFPAVIGMNFPSGSLPSTIFSSRNIAQIAFNHNQVTTYGGPKNTDPYYMLYPELNIDNTGQYSAWGWGVSRIIDGLELVQDVLPIDIKHLAVTGCSYAGKLALFAGALDERIALTIAQESGGGGYTTWRYSEEINKSVSVETLSKTDYNWFKNDMKQFAGSVPKLPEDHHELMAMVAPRALLVTGNPDYTWLADESGHVGSKAAKEVYKALGISDRFGYSIVSGHAHCAVPSSQIPEIEAFVEKFLLGSQTVNTEIATTPFKTNLSQWITWTAPVVSEGTSYFGKPSLVSPDDNQKDLDASVTLVWEKMEDVLEYTVQMSVDPAFKQIDKSTSTGDTSKSFSDLVEGKVYYWRVRAKNSIGQVGPWSNLRHLSTYIPLPVKPNLVSSAPYKSRAGYITFTWNKSEYADQYVLQFSDVKTFTYGVTSSTLTDTVKTFTGINEGVKYYWRVQARNISGSSTWSDVWDFVLITPPSDLTVQMDSGGWATLTWKDNSSVEAGYIIERKAASTNSFSAIDTVKSGVTSYIDKKIEGNITYIYRIKAYTQLGESDYSDEVSAVFVGIKDEENVPSDYYLSQNYPNPFNPSTNIKFDLPHSGLTKITVYDLLGREMLTLINAEMNAGYHEINFNGDRYQSGVYFYRISSGDFIQSKKMILLK